ncbi:MAG: DUF3343 domain-containing protein [Desulfurivibrionaceae bacterium]|jgi:hypothetical protein|nr:DUF3343 domain-containing protein [Pseudomonadota bacterium]MCG2823123.1 DUF3343 domain-containing protein [Desulfobulbaceae bacterium]MDP2003029.1 DUF3343 domain-containing protein [Desulfurivibrionaceae bacterium]MDP2756725.1 DUF3343 domain-containing protein [Desulfurivibrionaceae bacterium]PKN23027.1 MAG: hypothetical protein CVU68_02590 [Deltaproteobacteria bacterium HGW-Deltaproteobacteria-3]
MKTATQERQPSGSYVAIFSSIHYVLKAEQLLKAGNISLDVVPVPREISGDCGMAITFDSGQFTEVQSILAAGGIAIARIFCKEAEGVFSEIPWKTDS